MPDLSTNSDHYPIAVERFNGLYRRGTSDFFNEDETPFNHWCDCLNTQFFGDAFGTRFGASKTITKANILRTWPYLRLGEAARTIILTTGGNFYDSTDLNTPILTVPTATSFSAVNFFNRLFISPNDGTSGIAGEKVYVYDGTTCRAACGAAPVGVVTCADSASSGSVEIGTHLIFYVYETDSGFITPPNSVAVYAAPGGKKLDVSNIPVGPAFITARRAIATKTITYNGNPNGFALFFVPNGRIADNATTTDTLDFFDADLVDSADFLLDELTEIPAALVIGNYGSRLITLGENGNEGVMRASEIGDPESISSTSGFVIVDPTEAGSLTNCTEQRGLLYVTKGTHIYSLQDNGNDPDTWIPAPVDHGIGTASPFGLSQVFDNRGANLDIFFIADIGGLYGYNGIVIKPELTYKVQEVWSRINKLHFNKVQVINDTQNKIIYVTVPLDGSATCNYLLVGDYVQGLNYSDIRWALWQFPSNIASIMVSINPATDIAYLQVALTAGNIYSLISSQLTDDGTAIHSFIRLALITLKNQVGAICHFNAIRGRILGSGSLTTSTQGLDSYGLVAGETLTLSSAPGGEVQAKLDFQNERCSVKLNLASGWFKIRNLTLYAKELWSGRPS